MAIIPSGPVTATLSFYSPPADGSAPSTFVTAADHTKNYSAALHAVPIADIRGSESTFTLDHDSFQVLQNIPPSSAEADFRDDASIRKHYYPEVEALLLAAVPGATRVVIFDHTVRRTEPGATRAPVNQVHVDQTPTSAAQRVRRHIEDPAEADALLRDTRYRIINVWRPLNRGPVESWPLAFASSASVADDELVPIAHRYESGYTGETAGVRHSPDQKWHYLSGIDGSERLLLQCFDSEALKDGTDVRGGRVPHTAFEHPATSPDAEGRASIEVRTLVFGP